MKDRYFSGHWSFDDAVKAYEGQQEVSKCLRGLLRQWNIERINNYDPCPFCGRVPQMRLAASEPIDVHYDDCELKKELAEE